MAEPTEQFRPLANEGKDKDEDSTTQWTKLYPR